MGKQKIYIPQIFPFYLCTRSGQNIHIFRKKGTDYYKVKWAGWPKEAWSWVKSIDIDAEPINDFRRAMLAKLPMKAWPTTQQNYQIPEEYRHEIKSNYEINKMKQREELDRKQQLLRRLDPTVLIGEVRQ